MGLCLEIATVLFFKWNLGPNSIKETITVISEKLKNGDGIEVNLSIPEISLFVSYFVMRKTTNQIYITKSLAPLAFTYSFIQK